MILKKPGRYCLKYGSLGVKEIIDKKNRVYYNCLKCGYKHGRALIINPKLKISKVKDGLKHFTVGALTRDDNHYLLIHRRTFPFAWAIISGHLMKRENPDVAIEREVLEETGLRIKEKRLIFHGVLKKDKCRKGADIHEWYLYKCRGIGRPRVNEEGEELKWYKKEDLKKIKLSPTTKRLLRKIKLI